MELWLVSQACLIAPSIAEVVLPTNRILLPEHGHHPAALNFLIPGTHADARICGQVVEHQVAHSTAAWILVRTDRPEIPPNACCAALYTERSIAARYLECKFKPLPFGSFYQPLD